MKSEMKNEMKVTINVPLCHVTESCEWSFVASNRQWRHASSNVRHAHSPSSLREQVLKVVDILEHRGLRDDRGNRIVRTCDTNALNSRACQDFKRMKQRKPSRHCGVHTSNTFLDNKRKITETWLLTSV